MPTYLYGLILGDNAVRVPRDIAGIAGEPVRVLAAGAVSALVGSVDRLPERTRLADVKAHDAVLQAVVDAGVTAAAARFRQTFATDEDAGDDVREHTDRIARVLRDFDGCVEMRLLMPDTSDLAAGASHETAEPNASPGRGYLEQLRARHATAAHLAIAAMLGPVVRAERVALLPEGRGAVFAHLVNRDHVADYRDAVRAYPALSEATVVGPLALYSFAEAQP